MTPVNSEINQAMFDIHYGLDAIFDYLGDVEERVLPEIEDDIAAGSRAGFGDSSNWIALMPELRKDLLQIEIDLGSLIGFANNHDYPRVGKWASDLLSKVTKDLKQVQQCADKRLKER